MIMCICEEYFSIMDLLFKMELGGTKIKLLHKLFRKQNTILWFFKSPQIQHWIITIINGITRKKVLLKTFLQLYYHNTSCCCNILCCYCGRAVEGDILENTPVRWVGLNPITANTTFLYSFAILVHVII